MWQTGRWEESEWGRGCIRNIIIHPFVLGKYSYYMIPFVKNNKVNV
jgi:hypothetical protein